MIPKLFNKDGDEPIIETTLSQQRTKDPLSNQGTQNKIFNYEEEHKDLVVVTEDNKKDSFFGNFSQQDDEYLVEYVASINNDESFLLGQQSSKSFLMEPISLGTTPKNNKYQVTANGPQ
jgi:hypothetical protein